MRLRAIDVSTGKSWESLPEKLARQRDLYKVKVVSGADPLVVEKWLSRLESQFSEIISRVLDTESLPAHAAEMVVLFQFVAWTVTRVPAFRHFAEQLASDAATNEVRSIVRSPKQLCTLVRQMEHSRYYVSDEVLEQFKILVEDPSYQVSLHLSQNDHVRLMLEMVGPLVMSFGKRRWDLIKAPEEAGYFICSDQPVSVSLPGRNPYLDPPQFDMPNTLLAMPISDQFALVSTHEGKTFPTPASRRTVAILNSLTACKASRFLFARDLAFPWLRHDGVICTADALLRDIKTHARHERGRSHRAG